MANKNTKRAREVARLTAKATTGQWPQWVKPAEGHKAKVARKASR